MEGRKGVGGQGGKNAKEVDMPQQGRKRAIPGGDHLTTRGKMRELLRIMWAEPSVRAAPPTSSWATRHRASVESLSTSGVTLSDSSVGSLDNSVIVDAV